MTRPPWETYLIHGLDRLDNVPSGCVGLLTKMHHCAIDGQSGMEMAMAMADLTPEVAPGEATEGTMATRRCAVESRIDDAHVQQQSAATDSNRGTSDAIGARAEPNPEPSAADSGTATPDSKNALQRSGDVASCDGIQAFRARRSSGDEERRRGCDGQRRRARDLRRRAARLSACQTRTAGRPAGGDGADQYAKEQSRLFDGQSGQRDVRRDRHGHFRSQSPATDDSRL